MRYPLAIFTLLIGAFLSTSFKQPITKEGVYIIIDKTKFEIQLYDADSNWLTTYPCVFGNDDLGDKLLAGDRKTPEGTFHVILKKLHPKWDKFIALDYPTKEDYEKFNDRKAKGIIHKDAKIGGSIGIHGTWPKQDFVVDHFQNWTQGCICTKNEYIDELYKTIPIGTTVIIKK